MGAPTRYRKGLKPSSPTFDFMNRKLSGLPERDDPETRAEKDRKIAEWLKINRTKGDKE